MLFVPVSSSNIKEIGYDKQAFALYVRFLNGSQYRYDNVPEEEYEDFLNSSSKGQYLNENIKGVYPHSKA